MLLLNICRALDSLEAGAQPTPTPHSQAFLSPPLCALLTSTLLSTLLSSAGRQVPRGRCEVQSEPERTAGTIHSDQLLAPSDHNPQ